MYAKKRRWFNGVENLTLVTPSRWLSGKLEGSFLKEYPVQVIHNGIDRTVFRPCEKAAESSEKYTVLGVSYGWDDKKGLDVFLELAKRLGPEYRIVLVGTDEAVEEKLPPSITPIRRTQNQQELAQLYSAADVFVNPTREDTFPTVNMEALACGTGIVTFATGGSPEIPDESCGCVVEVDDLDALEQQILRIAKQTPYSREACLQRAACFHKDDRYREYIELYQQLTGADASGA
jgi:glycosyltransferase involved in cell wall biosynthesis